MKEKPNLSWKAEQDAMYTVGETSFEQIEWTFSGDDCWRWDWAIAARDLPALAGDECSWGQGRRWSWLQWTMNVTGVKVDEGVEVFQYVTPFSLELEDDGSIKKDIKESSHPMIVLVFKQQSGKVAKS